MNPEREPAPSGRRGPDQKHTRVTVPPQGSTPVGVDRDALLELIAGLTHALYVAALALNIEAHLAAGLIARPEEEPW